MNLQCTHCSAKWIRESYKKNCYIRDTAKAVRNEITINTTLTQTDNISVEVWSSPNAK